MLLVKVMVTIDIEVDEAKPSLAEDAATESVLEALKAVKGARYTCVTDAEHVPRRSDKLKSE